MATKCKPVLLVDMEAEADKARQMSRMLLAQAEGAVNTATRLEYERHAAWQAEAAKEWDNAIKILRQEWST